MTVATPTPTRTGGPLAPPTVSDGSTALFSFTTRWLIGAPIERVWEAISDVERWPTWWRYVDDVTVLDPGGPTGAGAVQLQAWRAPLLVRVAFCLRVTRADPPHALEGTAMGDLSGTGTWSLTRHDPLGIAGAWDGWGTSGVTRAAIPASGSGTLVRNEWHVRAETPLLVTLENRLGPLARRLMAWNHDVIMLEGGRALARHLGAELLEASPRPPTLRDVVRRHPVLRVVAATPVLGALVLLSWGLRRRTRGGLR
jgi:hypothetical protein